MFGAQLSRTRTRVVSFSSGFERYSQGCAGTKTTGNWLMVLADPDVPGGIRSYVASTAVDNETTPECRVLLSDLESDVRTIRSSLMQIDERARVEMFWPGVMRDLYRKFGLESVAQALVK